VKRLFRWLRVTVIPLAIGAAVLFPEEATDVYYTVHFAVMEYLP
jgi:hypothetical protein